jgi:ComF family protein
MCMSALAAMLDAIAPRRCAGCGDTAAWALCPDCVELLHTLPPPPPCGAGNTTCHAAFPFAGPVRRALHQGKYRGRRSALQLLAAMAAERLAPHLARHAPRPHGVVAVPLGDRRRRSRGYNQAAVVAAVMARLPAGGPLLDGLVRTRETRTQVGRSAIDRRANLEGAFVWRGTPLPAGALLWLVDDVVTTGATLDAAAIALQRAGAGRIEAVAASAAP